MEKLRILVVDDEEMIRWALGEFLQRRGDEYELASDGPEALEILRERDFDILLSDLAMPDMHGIELIREARALRPQMVAVVLTGYGSREDIIAAMKERVFEFIDKPIRDYSEFSLTLERAGRQSRLVRERDSLLEDLQRKNLRLEVSLAQLNEAYARLSRQDVFLEEDLRQAQRMHQRLLPKCFPEIHGLGFYGYFSPCARLGGDFFDVLPLSGERNLVGLYLADVAGHGVGAAMVTVIVRELIHAHKMLHPDSHLFEKPVEALKFINQGLLEEEFEPPVLVTMAYAVVDPATGSVEVACAGHPEPLLVTAEDRYTFAPCSGPVLGIQTSAEYRTARFQLQSGNYFLLYSDGVTDARNTHGEAMGDAVLGRTAAETYGHDIKTVGQALEKTLKKHLGAVVLEDDQTFLAVGRRGDAAKPAEAAPELRSAHSVHIIHPASNLEGHRADMPAGIEIGAVDGKCILALTGKASWRLARLLDEKCREAVAQGADKVYLDLRRCQYLDSTMLGVLYQNAEKWILFGASPELVRLFKEMGITQYLHFSDDIPLGARMEICDVDMKKGPDAEMMLSAHESLAELNEANHERFAAALDAMRKQGKGKK